MGRRGIKKPMASLRNQPTLCERLQRLPLGVIEEVRAHLGVEVRGPGNVGNWPYHVQLCFSLDLPGHARLDAALKTVEARLGLKSPEFSPWPLVINVDVTAQPEGL